MMLISLMAASTILALMVRIPRVRLRTQSFFRNFFITDIFYLLTGWIAGGSFALAYFTRGSDLVGKVSFVPRVAALSLAIVAVGHIRSACTRRR